MPRSTDVTRARSDLAAALRHYHQVVNTLDRKLEVALPAAGRRANEASRELRLAHERISELAGRLAHIEELCDVRRSSVEERNRLAEIAKAARGAGR